jgi:formate hydrogenlyase transcriptional activator
MIKEELDLLQLAATNRDLEAAIDSGLFRNDLYYRLNVFEMPSLRERREDIPLLVEYFIDRYAAKAGKKIGTIGREKLERLKCYDLPGNIRELQNVVERSVIVCDTEKFVVDQLSRRAGDADRASDRFDGSQASGWRSHWIFSILRSRRNQA